MSFQTFGLSEHTDSIPQARQPGPAELLHGNGLDEICRAQPAPQACGSSRRQNVIGSGGVISRGHSAVTPQKDRAGGVNAVEHVRCIIEKSEVLRRQGIREFNGFGDFPRQDDGAVRSQRFPGIIQDESLHQARGASLHFERQPSRRSNEDGDGVRIVLE